MGIRKYPEIKPNDRFGRLTVLGLSAKPAGYPHFYWDCACKCGNLKTVTDNKLKRKEVTSCGCFRREMASVNGKARRTHGEAIHGQETPEFSAWQSMIFRCSHPENPTLANWAGRGIKVCEKWLGSYNAFLVDVGRRPSPQHSLDRYPNNNGNYEPGNVRWATKKEQLRNTRVNKFLTINGETKCQVEWAEKFGLSPSSLSSRLRRKWPIERIISQPMRMRICQPS